MRVLLTRLAVMAACVLFMATAAFSQGAIGGVVHDASGAVLPGVTVEATSPALIERVRSAATDGNGQYLVADLRPGIYTVTFTLEGFTTLKREGLELSAGVTLPVNADLKVGTIQETVTVTGASPVVDVQNTTQQSVITREVLESIPRTRNQQLTGALLPGVVVQGRADVGGSQGEPVTQISIHGGSPDDQIWAVDGMKITEGGAGARRGFIVADSTVQEYTYETSSLSAEFPTGGVRMNLIPKDGGNVLAGAFFTDFTTRAMVSDNLSDTLRARGLTTTTSVNHVWDITPTLGGPISKDRLWFFATYRAWASSNRPAGAFYESDPNRPAEDSFRQSTANLRLTWQATPRNKFSAYHDRQWRILPYNAVSNLISPEASVSQEWPQLHLTQLKWNSPVTSRLLVEAGAYHYFNILTWNPSDASPIHVWNPNPSDPRAWPHFETTTGRLTGCCYNTSGIVVSTTQANWWGANAAVSYVTGSHALKVGFTHVQGYWFSSFPSAPPTLRFTNDQPFQVQLFAKPGEGRPRVNHDVGIYAQDQWKLRNLTLNLGVRFDYFNGQVDPQHAAAGVWFLADRTYPLIPDVPNWKDIDPRFGASYDLFGNGTTAVKGTVSRYLKSEATNFQGNVNPLGGGFSLGATDLRSWNDLNGDRMPQTDELGPSTNLNFGLPLLSVRPDEALRSGWGKRTFNWEYTASVQQQVFPGLALGAGYYRRSYGNLQWTHNLLVTAADYTPFSVTSPLDGTPVPQYNLLPSKRGVSNNVVQFAPNDSQVFQGVDITLAGRFGRGGIVSGGTSMGRTVTSTCTIGTVDPNQLRFCNVSPPFMAGSQYKFIVAHPLSFLPFGVRASGSFTSNPGPLIAANYTYGSAVAGVPLTTGSLVVNLVEPGSRYEGRQNRVDVRLTGLLTRSRFKFRPYVDLLNLGNISPVLVLNQTYGPTWLLPGAILVGRMIKLGVNIDF